tara:strand:+ start:45 stop:359 length:315 start_codon:yes stop_codon:yes gene_type:complete
MEKKPIEYRQHKRHNVGDGKYIIETIQDVSDIVEQNKQEFNNASTTWGDGDIFSNKIASIPNTVIDDLNHKQIMKGYQILDMKKFKEFMNHPDNRFFRTKPGKV